LYPHFKNKNLQFFFLPELQDLQHQAKIMFNDLHEEPFTAQYKRLKQQIDYVRKTYIKGSQATSTRGSHANSTSLSYFNRLHARSNDEVENLNRTKNRIGRESANFGRKNSKPFSFQNKIKTSVTKPKYI
jgi:hypothetical protein